MPPQIAAPDHNSALCSRSGFPRDECVDVGLEPARRCAELQRLWKFVSGDVAVDARARSLQPIDDVADADHPVGGGGLMVHGGSFRWLIKGRLVD